MFSALAAAPAMLPAAALAVAAADPDAPIMVNPWAEARWSKGKVRPSEAEFVLVVDHGKHFANPLDVDHMTNWIEVHCKDGTFVATELSKDQPDWMSIARRFESRGVPLVDAFSAQGRALQDGRERAERRG
jgi:hypothetical protein